MRFEALARQALAGDLVRARTVLAEALAPWRGPPLADVGDARFADGSIHRLGQLRLDALEDRSEVDLTTGRVAGGVAEVLAAQAWTAALRSGCSHVAGASRGSFRRPAQVRRR